MDRTDHVVSAMTELDRHLAERDWRQEPYVYAFWIEGRSGNGKSVLLLQLMRQLVIERSERVIWLDDASEHLLPLLETWAQRPPDVSGLCYVFVDDFYAPSKRALVDFQKIARLTRQHERVDWPILVTCGAPEQRHEWKASGDDEAFRTATWLLPTANPNEQNRLCQWFRERTGEEPKTASAFRKPEGLMISMMFEMREGEMWEFGHRFRQRLDDLGLLDALALPLALNRLYILAPGGWLDERQSDALRRLNQDQDFSMFTLSGRTGQFIRVTHPHLSDAIYRAIRERDDSIVRARDLHRAFARSLATDLATARLILYRVGQNHERLAEVDANELVRGMTEAWMQHPSSTKPFTAFDAASVWTNWTIWNARNPLIAELLGQDPLQRARETLGKIHPHWGALWGRLWDCFRGHQGLISDAEMWLASDEGKQSREWSVVWEKIFEHKRSEHQTLISLATSGADWLRNNEFLPDWNFVLRPIAATLPQHCPWDSSLRLLERFPGNRNWAYVFQIVAANLGRLDRQRWESALRLGSEWIQLAESRETPEWSYVWGKLVELRAGLPKESAERLLSIGYEWLAGREDRDEWSHIWRKLVELGGELPKESADRLLPMGYGWLAGREDRDEWSHIWRKLVELGGELPKESSERLLPIGCGWLAGREDRGEWSYVWQKLVELRGELPKESAGLLLPIGYGWLAGREDRDEWAHVWRKLVEVRGELPKESSERLLPIGCGWLAGREDRDEWAHVWRELVELRGELPEESAERLLPVGYGWLAGREDRDEWSFIWQELEAYGFKPPEGEFLEVLAWRWLQRPDNAGRGEWDKIWEACFEKGYRNPEFLAVGWQWVLDHAQLPQTIGLAGSLLIAGKNGDWSLPSDLIDWVRTWLAANNRSRSWTFGWGPLWAIDPSQETAALAVSWLASGPPIGSVRWVVHQIVDSRQPQITEILREWAGAHPASPQAAAIRRA